MGSYDSARHSTWTTSFHLQATSGARACWLVTRYGQPTITSTKGLDATPDSGSAREADNDPAALAR